MRLVETKDRAKRVNIKLTVCLVGCQNMTPNEKLCQTTGCIKTFSVSTSKLMIQLYAHVWTSLGKVCILLISEVKRKYSNIHFFSYVFI